MACCWAARARVTALNLRTAGDVIAAVVTSAYSCWAWDYNLIRWSQRSARSIRP
jgi:hypothetical protein